MQFTFFDQKRVLPRRRRAVTIGAFDGIHLGHQKLLAKLSDLKDRDPALMRTLVTFEPLPHEFFLKEKAPVRVMNLREKLIYLKRNHLVDEVIILPFDSECRVLPADQFIQRFLVESLNIAAIVVGDDFRFGNRALGTPTLLSEYSNEYNFEVFKENYHYKEGVRISSTLVRKALSEADFSLAAEYLGRSYTMISRVVKGNQLARTLGTPTINLPIKRFNPPFSGVFNVIAQDCGAGRKYFGVANLGFRPTVDGVKPNLEVHLHNVDENLYGKYFEIEFISKLRDEQKFEGIEALKAQIEIDNQRSKEFFKLI